ncbi:MAG: hypothetical protein WCA10_18530 [Terracidiphilus sp.]
MSWRSKFQSTRSFFALALLVLACAPMFGQLNSNSATVALTATLGESLTVSATPGTANFTLVSGAAATSGPVTTTTTWLMNRNRSTVTLVGYFASATAALTDGGSPANTIPTSAVSASVGAGTYNPFTGSGVGTGGTQVGVAGASLTLFTQAISNTNRSGTRNDNLTLKIDLSSQTQLPAGTYTGTLNLQAQAL